MVDQDDDWEDQEPTYDDEHNTCQHGITPKSDCDWCREQEE